MNGLSPRSIDGATGRALLVVEEPETVLRQRRGSAAKAAQGPIWLRHDLAPAPLSGCSFENKQQGELPELARRRDQQEQVRATL